MSDVSALVSAYPFILIALIGLNGCDDALIDPFNNDDRYYTIYGFLDQGKNFQDAIHAVRIIPVTRRPENIETPDAPQANFDGRVFLTDLNTDQTLEMEHTLEEFSPGKYGHIFRKRVFILSNHKYRLEVVRSDDIVTYAETHVPSVTGIRTIQQAPQVNSDSTVVSQDILLSDVAAIWKIDLIYYTGSSSCFSSAQNRVSYGRSGAPTSDGWALQLNFTEDLRILEDRLQVPALFVCAIGIRAQIMDDQWTLPEGEINYDELSLPNVQTNVVNGYGFFGSTSEYAFDWPLSSELSGLINPEDGD